MSIAVISVGCQPLRRKDEGGAVVSLTAPVIDIFHPVLWRLLHSEARLLTLRLPLNSDSNVTGPRCGSLHTMPETGPVFVDGVISPGNA